MKKAFLIGSIVVLTLFVSGCESNNLLEGIKGKTDDTLDCKVKEGYEDTMEGSRYVFTFVDGYATQKEVSKEFDTKEDAKAFYDTVSGDSANVLDNKRVYYVQKVPDGVKYTREEVKESMEKQNCICE